MEMDAFYIPTKFIQKNFNKGFLDKDMAYSSKASCQS